MKLRFLWVVFSALVVSSVISGAWAAEAETGDVYAQVFRQVNQESLQALLKDMTGVNPVTVKGENFSITDRYFPESKRKYRAYWKEYFESLGMPVAELNYPTRHRIGESEGHDLEAVLKGQSADSIVIIVHYDSTGPRGHEAENPGVDDDMTGMAILMESARILAGYQGRLQHTVRFVAADYEEHGSPGLEGARYYARYLQNLAKKDGFKIVGAVDNEQTGWNCFKEGGCSDGSRGDTFDVYSCSGDMEDYNFPAMGDALEKTAKTYSALKVHRDCIGAHSDHYAMWEIGVPTVVFSEHEPFKNPHFDHNGGDTYEKIDQEYYFKIAQVGVTFAAQLAKILN